VSATRTHEIVHIVETYTLHIMTDEGQQSFKKRSRTG